MSRGISLVTVTSFVAELSLFLIASTGWSSPQKAGLETGSAYLKMALLEKEVLLVEDIVADELRLSSKA
jgi:hypothetical protein